MAFYLTAPCHYPNEHWLIVIEDHWHIFQFLSISKYLPFKDMLLKNQWNIGLLVWCWVISHVQTPPDGSSLFRRSSMMTSSNGNIFRVTGLLCGEFTSHGEFPAQTPVRRSFDVFFDLHRNQQLSKLWSHRWFETLPRSLWRHSIAFPRCTKVILTLLVTGSINCLELYERRCWLHIRCCAVF